MSLIDKPGFRPLAYYQAQFPDRLHDPSVLDASQKHMLIMRLNEAPELRSVFETPVIIQSVNEHLGVFVTNLLFITASGRDSTSQTGEMFDGVWTPISEDPLTIQDTHHEYSIADGIIVARHPPIEPWRLTHAEQDLTRERDLLGV